MINLPSIVCPREFRFLSVLILVLSVTLAALTGAPATAIVPGDLDPTFGTSGIMTNADSFGAQALVLQPDGKFVTAGTALVGGGVSGRLEFALVRYNTDGSLDQTFGMGGAVTTAIGEGHCTASGCAGAGALALVLQPDGKLVAVGDADEPIGSRGDVKVDLALARYNADGSLDPTFGAGGTVTTPIGVSSVFGGAHFKGFVLQPDGKLVVAGRVIVSDVTFADGRFALALARYDVDGSLDLTFGTGGTVITLIGNGNILEAQALVLQPDGKLVVAGDANVGVGGPNVGLMLARYNADGSLDGTFGAGGAVVTQIGSRNTDGRALVLQPDGKLVAAGGASGPFALARYNADGSLDGTFGTGGTVTTTIGSGIADAQALVLQPDGKLVAAGRAGNSQFGFGRFALARYYADGSPDGTFGISGDGTLTTLIADGFDSANGLVLQPDGKLVAAGEAVVSGQGAESALVRYFDITCGDGVVDLPPEQCDDGNLVNGDGCEADCTYTPVCQSVVAGGTVTTDISGRGVFNDFFPMQVAVTTPNAGQVCINMQLPPPGGSPVPGFTVVGPQAHITAPPGSPTMPLIVEFLISPALLPPDADPNTIPVFKDGQLVPPCIGPAGIANPDPCVSQRVLVPCVSPPHGPPCVFAPAVQITVLTSTASVWTLTVPTAPGCGNGVVEPGEQCDDGNIVSGDCCSATCQVENLGTSTCGVGACQQTVATCVNGVPQACIPGAPGVEGPFGSASCNNGIDDDCDGLTDRDDPDCNAPPDCSAAVATPSTLWPPNHKYAKISVTDITDPDGDPVSITITGMAQDEPLDSFGDGHTCPDGAGIGTSTALVRAERARSRRNSRDGRVYHVSFTADDGRGGQCTGTVPVCVPSKKRGTCVDEGPLFDSTGPCR